jgi:hypothetical protein
MFTTRRGAVIGLAASWLLAACAQGQIGADSRPSPTASATTVAQAPTAEPSPSEAPGREDLVSKQGRLARFSDSFADDDSGWLVGKNDEQGVTSRARYRNGAYEVTMTVPKRAKFGAAFRSFAPARINAWGNVEASVDARKIGTTGPVGLMCFQAVDRAGGYEFGVDSDGYVAIVKRLPKREETLASDVVPGVVRPQGGNRLRIECIGTDDKVELRFHVNGQELLRTVDASEPLYRRGLTGVLLLVGRGGAVDAVFDDFIFKGAL